MARGYDRAKLKKWGKKFNTPPRTRRRDKPDCEVGEPCGNSCVNRRYKCRERLTGRTAVAIRVLLGESKAEIQGAVGKALKRVKEVKGKRLTRLREYKSFATGDAFESNLRAFLKDTSNPELRAKLREHANRAYDKKRRDGETNSEYQQRAYNREYEMSRASMDLVLAETLPRNEGESDADYQIRKDNEKFAAAKRMSENASINPSNGLRREISDDAVEKAWNELPKKERDLITKRGGLPVNSTDFYDPETGGNGKMTEARGKLLLKKYLEQGGLDLYTGKAISFGESNLEHINPHGWYGKRAENPDNWGFIDGTVNQNKGTYEAKPKGLKKDDTTPLQSYTDWISKSVLTEENDNLSLSDWQKNEREVNESRKLTDEKRAGVDPSTVAVNKLREEGKTDAEILDTLYSEWESGSYGIVPQKKRYYAPKYAGFKTDLPSPRLRGGGGVKPTVGELEATVALARGLKNDPDKFVEARDEYNKILDDFSKTTNQIIAEVKEAGGTDADVRKRVSVAQTERIKKIEELRKKYGV